MYPCIISIGPSLTATQKTISRFTAPDEQLLGSKSLLAYYTIPSTDGKSTETELLKTLEIGDDWPVRQSGHHPWAMAFDVSPVSQSIKTT